MKKRLLSVFLTLAMVFSVVPVINTAQAMDMTRTIDVDNYYSGIAVDTDFKFINDTPISDTEILDIIPYSKVNFEYNGDGIITQISITGNIEGTDADVSGLADSFGLLIMGDYAKDGITDADMAVGGSGFVSQGILTTADADSFDSEAQVPFIYIKYPNIALKNEESSLAITITFEYDFEKKTYVLSDESKKAMWGLDWQEKSSEVTNENSYIKINDSFSSAFIDSNISTGEQIPISIIITNTADGPNKALLYQTTIHANQSTPINNSDENFPPKGSFESTSTPLTATLTAPALKTAPATTVTGVTVDGAAATASAVTWSANATAANGYPAAGTGTYTANFDITAPDGVTFTEGQSFSISIDGATSARAAYEDAHTATVTAVFPAITKTPASISAEAKTTSKEVGDSYDVTYAPITITYNDGTTFTVDASSASYASSGVTVDTSALTGGGKGTTSLTINGQDKNKTFDVTATLGTLSAVIEKVKVIENAPPPVGTSVYAVYDNGTLTFKYDDPSKETTGTTYTNFLINQTAAADLPWNSVRNDITKVVFDRSFGYTFPSNTSYWFADCANLTEIEGIEYLVTTNTTNMSNMFAGCEKLVMPDLSTLNTSKVTDMSGMFKDCKALTDFDVSNFDIKSVTNTSSMFEGCTGITELDVSEWDTTALTTADNMFKGCSALKTIYADEASDWTGITSGTNMFDGCSALVGGNGTSYSVYHKDKSYAISDSVEKKGYFTATHVVSGTYAVYDGDKTLTFKYSENPVRERGTIFDAADTKGKEPWLDINNQIEKVVFSDSFAEARPKNTMYWFNGFENLTSIEGIENLNTSDVTDMGYMFEDCSNLESVDISGFDTSKVTNMDEMFSGCEKLKTLDVSGLDTSKVSTASRMFENCKALTALDVTGFDMSNVTAMSHMFDGCSSIRELNIASWDISKVTNVSGIFANCSSLERIIASTDTDWSGINSGDKMFENCTKLEGGAGTKYAAANIGKTYAVADGYNGKKGYFTATSAAKGAYAVYDGSETLTFKYSDKEIREFGAVYNVENTPIEPENIPWREIRGKIKTVIFEPSFTAARPRSTANWFNGMSNLTAINNIRNLNTSETTNMSGMFVGYKNTAYIDVTQFNTAKVTDMSRMFEGCTGLQQVDITKFDTSNVTAMNQMFSNCSALKSIDITKLKTDKVTDMSAMFNGCSTLKTIDVSKLNTGRVTNMERMFQNCSGLETINAGDVADWKTSTVSSSADMFKGCVKLKGVIAYDASKTDVNMANTTTGYFKPLPPSPPTIDGITGDMTGVYGEGTTITVNATAPANHSLLYQWYTNTTESNEGGTAIDGAANASYVIDGTVGAGTYYYYCVVTAKRDDNGLTDTGITEAVAVTITKADQAAPAVPAASGTTPSTITVEAATGGVNGVEYAISATEEEPENGWTSDTTFTGLETDTTYYIYVRYKGDDSHNVSPSSHAAVKTSVHVHEWEYTASGTTITAVCKNTDGVCPDTAGGTVTIAAPADTEYDGNPHEAVITSALTTGDAIQVKYEYKSWGADKYAEINDLPINSGMYKASVTLGDATITVSYSITVTQQTPEPEPTAGPDGEKLYTVGGGTIGSGMPIVPIPNVKLRIDSLDMEIVSGAYGLFQFDNVPAGKYTLTVVYTDSNGVERTKDQIFEVNGNDMNRIIVVPDKNVSSVVEVDDSLDNVYVDKLDDVAGDLAKDEPEDADVTIKLTLEPKAEDDTSEIQNEIRKLAGDDSDHIDYIDVKVTKTIGDGEAEVIGESDKSVRILIPFDSEKQYSVKVYHYDTNASGDTKAVSLSTNKSASEYYEITDDGYIAITTNKFTTYAIGYDDEPAPTPTPIVIRRGGGGGGGSSSSSATPTPAPTASPEPSETTEPTPTPKPGADDKEWWFIDVPEEEWFYSPIYYAYYNDLMYGTSENTFEPRLEITRAMFVTVLYRIDGEPEAELDYTFEDIEEGSYYEQAVAWGSANDIIAGYSAEEYAPHDTITREQMAAILWRYAKYKGTDVSIGDETSIDGFEDAAETSEYAIPAFRWAYGDKILSGFGDNTLRPLSYATRAQASMVLSSYNRKIKE